MWSHGVYGDFDKVTEVAKVTKVAEVVVAAHK